MIELTTMLEILSVSVESAGKKHAHGLLSLFDR